jgi:outer membrane receptor protein involved in Fe transport
VHPLTSAAKPGTRLIASWAVALLLIVSPVLGDVEQSADTDNEETGEVEATAVAPPKREERVTATSLTQTMDADSGVSVQTLCTNCNNADLSMGGLDNDHVAVTCDGLPVPSGLAQVYLLSIMPPTVIDKVAVKKGASETQLPGGAVGGGIEIERRTPEPGIDLNFSMDSGDYGWTGSRFDVSGKSGRFGGALVTSWATSDLVDADVDGNPDLPSFDRLTVDGSAEVRLGRKQRLRVGGQVYDESQEDGPAAWYFSFMTFEVTDQKNLENVELERQQVDALYEGEFDDGSRLEVSFLSTDRSQDIEETEFPPFDFFNDTYFIDESSVHAGASWSRAAGQQAMMRAGFSYSSQDYEVVDVNFNGLQGVPGFVLEENVDEWGVWVEGEVALGGRVDLSTGVRFAAIDYTDNEAELVALNPSREEWLGVPLPDGDRLLPRTALTWKPVDAVSLRVSAGAGFRAPMPIYDEVCCGRRYRNNRGVAAEKSESYGIEVNFQPAPRFRLGGSVFLTEFEDRILRMMSLSHQVRPVYQNVNVPDSRYTSLTLDTSWNVTDRTSVKASASWLDAENRTPNNAIPVLIDFGNAPTPREFTTSTIPYTAKRRASLALRLKAPRRAVNVNVTAQYTGPTLLQEIVDPTGDLGGSEIDFVSFASSEDFVVLNFGLSKAFRNGLALYGGVDNVGDYVQSDLASHSFDYNWGPLRGRYVYGGMSYHFDTKSNRSQ